MQITGHAAIVTGGGSGLGAATAERLAKAGARVAVLDVNKDAATAVAKKIGGIAVHCDVTDAKSGEEAIAEAAASHNTARILINCAGVGPAKRIVGKEGPQPLTDFERVVKINLIGTFNMLRLTAAAMQTLEPVDGERGVIINTASVAADRTGGLCLVQGRRRGTDITGGARAGAIRHPRTGHRPRHLRHADAARVAAGSTGFTRRVGAVSEAARRAVRICRAGAAHDRERLSQRRKYPH